MWGTCVFFFTSQRELLYYICLTYWYVCRQSIPADYKNVSAVRTIIWLISWVTDNFFYHIVNVKKFQSGLFFSRKKHCEVVTLGSHDCIYLILQNFNKIISRLTEKIISSIIYNKNNHYLLLFDQVQQWNCEFLLAVFGKHVSSMVT